MAYAQYNVGFGFITFYRIIRYLKTRCTMFGNVKMFKNEHTYYIILCQHDNSNPKRNQMHFIRAHDADIL